MRAIQLCELSINGRVSMKLSPLARAAFGCSKKACKYDCITGLMSDAGSLKQGLPVWACWPEAFVGSGFPAASQRNGFRRNTVLPFLVDEKVEKGLKICL